MNGRGGRIRTYECRDQNPVPWATWRRPCGWFAPPRTPDSWAGSGAISFERGVQRRTCRTGRQPDLQARRQRCQRRLGGFARGELDETAAAGPGQARRSDLRQRSKNGLYGRLARAQYRLERIPERYTRNEVGYCRGRGIPRQFRRAEKSGGGRVHSRIGQQVPGRRQRNRSQLLPYPFGPGILAAHEDGYVGPQLQPQLGQAIQSQVRLPKRIEGHEDGSGIRRTTTEAATCRNPLFHADVDT